MAGATVNNVFHDLSSLLSSEDRDFLVRNNGNQVKVRNLAGKILGLYFSASWCPPCRRFTPEFARVYEELKPKGDFEVVFISSDKEDDAFNEYFSVMPWLAIPFSDQATRKRLKELFKVRGIPNLVFLDKNGKVTSDQGVKFINDYGVEAYPFSTNKLDFYREEEENARQHQTLSSLLVSKSRDHVISDVCGTQIPVSQLEGKMVGLYFSAHSHPLCLAFTPKLAEFYTKLKVKTEKFEVVLVSLSYEEEEFKKDFNSMPWLALPFKDKYCEKLARYFNLRRLPVLVIIGPDGKTLNSDAANLITDHGIEAYPFSPDKLVELAEIQNSKIEAETLESILVHGENDFVIEKSGSKVPVSELVGKTILLYFSAQWRACHAFLPTLIESYHEIRKKDDAFEVVFISFDKDQDSFKESYSGMPWLAIPFDDARKTVLLHRFKVEGFPAVVVIGPSGRTVSTEAKKYLAVHRVDAYPFTEEHFRQLDEKLEETAKGWPDKIKYEVHPEHELLLIKSKGYFCDNCHEMGYFWSFSCQQCKFDFHPKCALKKEETEEGKEGRKCDGDVCQKA